MLKVHPREQMVARGGDHIAQAAEAYARPAAVVAAAAAAAATGAPALGERGSHPVKR